MDITSYWTRWIRIVMKTKEFALETVEPGVTDRFVSSYEKTREQIRM